MSTQNSTRPDTACQQVPAAPRSVRLDNRFGCLLRQGFTCLPTLCLRYAHRLNVTDGELVLILHLCSYWWSERPPAPRIAALAAAMGKSERAVQRTIAALQGKGLLQVRPQHSVNGRQNTNAYDLTPFLRAVEGLARIDGLLGDAHDRQPDGRGAARGDGSDAGGVTDMTPQIDRVERDIDNDSMPPDPPFAQTRVSMPHQPGAAAVSPPVQAPTGNAMATGTTPRPTAQGEYRGAVATATHNPALILLAERISALSAELGDDAPASSLTRACTLYRDAGVGIDRFLALLAEAARRTRERQQTIWLRQRDGQTPKAIPYLFAVLQDLLRPAPLAGPQAAPWRPAPRRPVPSADTPLSDHLTDRPHPPDGETEHGHGPDQRTEPDVGAAATEADVLWQRVLAELRPTMTADNFRQWFAETQPLEPSLKDGLRIAVSTLFHKQWLERKLAGRVRAALQRLGYANLPVCYEVAAA